MLKVRASLVSISSAWRTLLAARAPASGAAEPARSRVRLSNIERSSTPSLKRRAASRGSGSLAVAAGFAESTTTTAFVRYVAGARNAYAANSANTTMAIRTPGRTWDIAEAVEAVGLQQTRAAYRYTTAGHSAKRFAAVRTATG